MAEQTKIQQHRTYSDWQIVQAVSLYNLHHNYEQVSRELDIPVGTIRGWIQGNRVLPMEEKIDDFSIRTSEGQKRMLDAMQMVMTEALQQVHRKIKDTSAAQAATIFGILFDKMQIMLGNSQQITNNNILIDMSGMTADDKQRLMARALARQQDQDVQ